MERGKLRRNECREVVVTKQVKTMELAVQEQQQQQQQKKIKKGKEKVPAMKQLSVTTNRRNLKRSGKVHITV